MDKIFPHLAPNHQIAATPAPVVHVSAPSFMSHPSVPVRRAAAVTAPALHKEPSRSINQGQGFFCQACGLRMKKHSIYEDSAGELHYECPEN